MDTKEKKREQTRQPAPQQERRRKSATEEMTHRESRPRKQAQPAEKLQKPQRPAVQRPSTVQRPTVQKPAASRPQSTSTRPAPHTLTR
jgi:hypothetical protein